MGVPPESTRGALSNKKTGTDARNVICTECAGIKSGVSVPQDNAIEILARHNPRAAAYWREQGFPRKDGNDCFFFEEDAIEITSGVTRTKLRVFDDMETGHWEEMPFGIAH